MVLCLLVTRQHYRRLWCLHGHVGTSRLCRSSQSRRRNQRKRHCSRNNDSSYSYMFTILIMGIGHSPVVIDVVDWDIRIRSNHGTTSHDEPEGSSRYDDRQRNSHQSPCLDGWPDTHEEAKHTADHGSHHCSLDCTRFGYGQTTCEPLPFFLSGCQYFRIFEQIGSLKGLQMYVIVVERLLNGWFAAAEHSKPGLLFLLCIIHC